jgi:hypothetical protein
MKLKKINLFYFIFSKWTKQRKRDLKQFGYSVVITILVIVVIIIVAAIIINVCLLE